MAACPKLDFAIYNIIYGLNYRKSNTYENTLNLVILARIEYESYWQFKHTAGSMLDLF